jgi:hypothetical protein
MNEVRPASYRADEFLGVEHISSGSLLALDGNLAGFRLCFGRRWGLGSGSVHIFLTEPEAARLGRLLLTEIAMEAELKTDRGGPVDGSVAGAGGQERGDHA